MMLVHGPLVGIAGNSGYEAASKDAWAGDWRPDCREGGVAMVPSAAVVADHAGCLPDRPDSDDQIDVDDRWQHGALDLARHGVGDDAGGIASPQLCRTPSDRGSPRGDSQLPPCSADPFQQGMVQVWHWSADTEFVPSLVGFVGGCAGCCIGPFLSPEGGAVAACGSHFFTAGQVAQGPPTPSTSAPSGPDGGMGAPSPQSTPQQPHTPQADEDATGAWVQVGPSGCASWVAGCVPVATAAGLLAAAQAREQPTPSTAILPAGHGGRTAFHVGSGEADAEQLPEAYARQLQQQDEQLAAMHQSVAELEHKRAEVRHNWEHEREEMLREVARYREILQRYCIPLEEACDRVLFPFANATQDHQPQQQCAGVTGGNDGYDRRSCAAGSQAAAACTLDDKMQKLNGLLADRPAQRTSPPLASAQGAGEREGADRGKPPAPHADVGSLRVMGGENESKTTCASDADGRGGPGQASACPAPLAALFPEVADRASELEQRTQSQIDERARKALHGLPTHCALEALQSVGDLVESQGGRCRNLSSILQSTCRKLERRAAAAASGRGGAPGASRPSRATPPASGGKEEE